MAAGQWQAAVRIATDDGRSFAFAGLWEHWEGDGIVIESCTIVVTTASAQMQAVHGRMPVILDPAGVEAGQQPAAR